MSILTWVPRPLHSIRNDGLMKTKIDFAKNKIHLNENIKMTFHAFWIEFKFLNWIQIQLKRNGDANWYKRYWKCASGYVIQKQKTSKKHKFEKTTFPFLFTWQLVKQIPIWNCHRPLLRPKVSLPKPIPMNHCHWNYKWSLKRWKFYNTLPWL